MFSFFMILLKTFYKRLFLMTKPLEFGFVKYVAFNFFQS